YMKNKLKNINIIVVVCFFVRSVLCFIGRSDFPNSVGDLSGDLPTDLPDDLPFNFKGLLFGNETLVDIGNQLFCIVCFLAVCYVAVTLINNVKEELFKNIGNYPHMRGVWQEWENGESVTEMSTAYLDYLMNFEETNRKQCSYLFFAAIVAFATGIVLIGGGMVFAYSKMGNMVMALLVLTSIISELISICFGFIANKLMKRADMVHKLVNKKAELSLLLEEAEEQGNKEEMILELFEKALND
ncbi:MAG: hypothetical protein K2N89_11430, partial [Lachnospiraceae bacterium]|nr:hypothetical protein [Lachnospiraceae bacterium]